MIVHASSRRVEPRMRGVLPVVAPRRFVPGPQDLAVDGGLLGTLAL